MTLPSSPSRLRVWLQLLRAPNLFTVPGDPIAGYLLANDGFTDHSLILVAAASLCFYSAGLLMNDLVDIAEDREDRPNRPMPSGQADPKTVQRTLWILNFLGLLLLFSTGSVSSLIWGLIAIAAVGIYNHFSKKWTALGALNMGLCRTCSVMIGATAGPSPSAVLIATIFAIVTGLYIAAVTHLARYETRPQSPVLARLLPIVPLLLGAAFGAKTAIFAPDKVTAAFLFALPVLGAAWLLLRLFSSKPPPLPPCIGAHIRLLLPLQAAVCWLGASQSIGPASAVALLFLWPISRSVAKRFYAS